MNRLAPKAQAPRLDAEVRFRLQSFDLEVIDRLARRLKIRRADALRAAIGRIVLEELAQQLRPRSKRRRYATVFAPRLGLKKRRSTRAPVRGGR